MISNKYQKSICSEKAGLLHDYKPLYSMQAGMVEKCANHMCGDKQLFPHGIPNDVYLSHHIRSALQPSDPLFRVNYPDFDYSLLGT